MNDNIKIGLVLISAIAALVGLAYLINLQTTLPAIK